MNFNKVHRYVRFNKNGDGEYLDIVPNKLKGWKKIGKAVNDLRPEMIYFDEIAEVRNDERE